MTCALNHKNLVSYVGNDPPKHNVIVKKVGVLQRIFDVIFDAIHESRRRQTDRDIANFFARRGGCITDDIEREMTRRLLMSNWSARE